MASRASLNKVLLIGNLTRDPELRYTPSGAAVCSFTIATNRTYVASDGNKKEETEFTRVVSWNKLAELCSQLLTKGRKVFVEGRLQTRSWETPDGQTKTLTEVVIDDMRILDSRRTGEESHYDSTDAAVEKEAVKIDDQKETGGVEEVEKETKAKKTKTAKQTDDASSEDAKVDLDDLPF